jgi:hypothetical protein
MKTILNSKTLLWAIGIIQPATIEEILGVFSKVLEQTEMRPTSSMLETEIKKQVRAGHLMCVVQKPARLYSLTYAGHLALPRRLRKLRDKTRLFLLHKARRARLNLSRGVRKSELAGDAPALDASTAIKEAAANNSSCLRPKWSAGQPNYWPRLSERFVDKTGPKAAPRDIQLRCLSFASLEQLRLACDYDANTPLFNITGIGVALGISPALIVQILNRPERHYREFTLPKKGGGLRKIESPRIFLKTIQGFLADYVLFGLKIHDSVHSFRRARSIITNAAKHEQKNFVANIDVKDFFGSINKNAISKILAENGFNDGEADTISSLCTKQDSLPQGAPTSPVISNAALFYFDGIMEQYCTSKSIAYSRYADDITFSGSSRPSIITAISMAETFLKEGPKLFLNKKKTRIASRGGQQRVTGVVVNVRSAPSRRLRREIRAMFHNAKISKAIPERKLLEMAGYLNYLNAFPKYAGSDLLDQYSRTLSSLASSPKLRGKSSGPTGRRTKK